MKKSLSAILIGAMVLMVSVFAGTAGASDHQITICHATSSETNPYTVNDTPKQQIARDKGHGNQQGVHPGDIIPPFSAGDHGPGYEAFAGQNWDAKGQAIWANGCEIDNPDTVCETEPESCEPDPVCTYAQPELCEPDIGTPDSVERPPAAQSPPVVVSPPTDTVQPTQPVTVAGPAAPVPVTEDELAYTGPSGMLIGTAMVGLGLLFSGLALRRRFAQNI